MSAIAYTLHDGLYLNITNRCTMDCTYCIKHAWNGRFHEHDLRLTAEPSPAEVIEAIGDPQRYREIVFCGYGDALIRLEAVKEIAAWVKSRGGRVRINTAGLANRYHGRDIAPELAGLVDTVSISLNSADETGFIRINRPHFEDAVASVLAFARACTAHIPEVTITAVALPGVDIERIRALAVETGAGFRVRPALDSENA